MKVEIRKQCLIALFIISVYFPCCLFAETIVFKSKETINGKIINRTDKYIVVNVGGENVSYPIDAIESIDGEKIAESIAVKESSNDKSTISHVGISIGYGSLPDTSSYINRGLTSQIKGDYDQAISDFTKAIEINPNNADAYNNRGLIYEIKGSYDQAIADLNKAIEIAPDSEGAYCNRGNAYSHIGNYEQAVADFNRAIELNSNSSTAYYGRGRIYLDKDDYDRAIADFTKAIAIAPDYAEAYCNRGYTYVIKGDYDSAVVDFNKAIEINPKFAAAYNNRAIVYYKKKNYTASWSDVYKTEELGLKVKPGLIAALNKVAPQHPSKAIVLSRRAPQNKKINYSLVEIKGEREKLISPSATTDRVVFNMIFFGGVFFMLLISVGLVVLIYKILPKDKMTKTCPAEEFLHAQVIIIPLSDGGKINIKPDSEFFVELVNSFTDDKKPPIDNVDFIKLHIKVRNKKYTLAVSLSGWNFQGEDPNCRVLRSPIQAIRIIDSIQKDYLEKQHL